MNWLSLAYLRFGVFTSSVVYYHPFGWRLMLLAAAGALMLGMAAVAVVLLVIQPWKK